MSIAKGPVSGWRERLRAAVAKSCRHADSVNVRAPEGLPEFALRDVLGFAVHVVWVAIRTRGHRPRRIVADGLSVAIGVVVICRGSDALLALVLMAGAWDVVSFAAWLVLPPEPPFWWIVLTAGAGVTWSRSCAMWGATVRHSGHVNLKFVPGGPGEALTPVGDTFLSGGFCWTVRAVERVSNGQLLGCSEGEWPRDEKRRRRNVSLEVRLPLLEG